jgi:hypothetical protein
MSSFHLTESMDQILDRFDDAWNGPTPPRIEDFLTIGDSCQRLALLVELVRIDLERRLTAGELVRVEEVYLERFPELKTDRAVVVSLAAREFELRRASEPNLALAEYLSRFPEYRPELLVRLPTIDEKPKAEPTIETVPPLPQATAFAPGGQLGCYELIEELGRGGMGVVYLARDSQLKRLVAIKMVLCGGHSSEGARDRFRAEAEAIARLQHPHVVQVFSWGQQDALPYLVMEHIEGGRLDRRIAGQPQPPADAAHLLIVLARAVHAAHRAGIIHRDLKPANILLAPPGDEAALNTVYGCPKVSDFGLARLSGVSPVQTASLDLLGTPSYMAPEQAAGKAKEVGPAADIYSLGAILYELLTGRPPFVGVTILDILDQVKNQEPLPFSRLRIHVPRDLETICLKCLQKDPQKRYSSAEELADDLQRFREGRPIVARPIGVLDSIWLWCHRPERVREAGIFSVIAGIMFIFWALFGIVSLAVGAFPQARNQEALHWFLGMIFLIYCPMILIGLGSIARMAFVLWIGLGASFLAFVFLTAVVFQNLLSFTFDFGGIYTSNEIRTPTFRAVSFRMP